MCDLVSFCHFLYISIVILSSYLPCVCVCVCVCVCQRVCVCVCVGVYLFLFDGQQLQQPWCLSSEALLHHRLCWTSVSISIHFNPITLNKFSCGIFPIDGSVGTGGNGSLSLIRYRYNSWLMGCVIGLNQVVACGQTNPICRLNSLASARPSLNIIWIFLFDL